MTSKRLTFERHGKPAEVLKISEARLPELESGEVLIEIQASPLNPADLNYIEGTYGIKPTLPAVAGMECYGTVIQSRSRKFSEGDGVIPLEKIGGWSTHAVTSADNLIRLPAGIDPLQAAMLKVNPATAWLLLHHFTNLTSGDWVTLNAANSGVGQCVIQIAKQLGINTLCFLRNKNQAEEMSALGATLVLHDDSEGYETAKESLGKIRARLALNAVGGESALRLMKLLAEGGTHVTYGAMGRKPLTIPNGPLIFGDIRMRGLWVTKWMEKASREELENTYQPLARHVLEGRLKQKVDSTHPLGNFGTALARLDAGDRNGKVLFKNPSAL